MGQFERCHCNNRLFTTLPYNSSGCNETNLEGWGGCKLRFLRNLSDDILMLSLALFVILII